MAAESAKELARIAALHQRIMGSELGFETDLDGVSDSAWDKAIEAARKELLKDVESSYRKQADALTDAGLIDVPTLQKMKSS